MPTFDADKCQNLIEPITFTLEGKPYTIVEMTSDQQDQVFDLSRKSMAKVQCLKAGREIPEDLLDIPTGGRILVMQLAMMVDTPYEEALAEFEKVDVRKVRAVVKWVVGEIMGGPDDAEKND